MLPTMNLLDSNDASVVSEKAMATSFLVKLSRTAETKESNTLVRAVMSEAYASVGFGPMLAALKRSAA